MTVLVDHVVALHQHQVNWSLCKLRVFCTIAGQEEDGKGYELYLDFLKLIIAPTENVTA